MPYCGNAIGQLECVPFQDPTELCWYGRADIIYEVSCDCHMTVCVCVIVM